MRNTLHDTEPGQELERATDKDVIELLKDEQGNELKVYGYGGDVEKGSFAYTDRGELSLEYIMTLRSGGTMKVIREGDMTTRELLALSGMDAGDVARGKILTRGQKVKRAMVRTYILFITLAVLIVGGAAGYVYYEFTKPGKRMVDYRACQYVDEKQGVEITGKREYSYLERSLFGVNFRLDKDIEEKTQIDIKGDSITVAGLSKDGTWWSKFADMGERGIMILNHADQYVFATKKKAVVVGYEQFCR